MDDKPLLLVKWWDHSGSNNNGWETEEELIEYSIPVVVSSVGWLVYETKKHLVLAAARSIHGLANDQCILKNCIISRKVMKS